jgi:hypothetical protein
MELRTPNRIHNRSLAAPVLMHAVAAMVCLVAALNLLGCAPPASAQNSSPLPAPLMQEQADGQMPGGDGAPGVAPQRLKRQQSSNGDTHNTQLPYNGSANYQVQPQPQSAPMPYTGVEQWSGNHLGPSSTLLQSVENSGYPDMRQRRHHRHNGRFGLVNNTMNQGMRPRRDQDPTATDNSVRPPDQFADNPSIDADGVRHFANGQHFDLNKVSINQAIGAVKASDPDFARVNRKNPNSFGPPANNGLLPMNFGAFR